MTESRPKWQEIVELKKNIQKSALNSYINTQQSELSREICAQDDLSELCEQLLSGTWKAEDVIRAYAQQAAAAHEKVRFSSQSSFALS